MFSQGSCWNSPIVDEALLWEILIDVYSSLLCGCWYVLYQCGGHPSCDSDWCMGSLCVALSYLFVGSAVHCGSCLHHPACGCPPSGVTGCERGGDLCLKGRWGKAGGEGGAGVSNQRSIIRGLYLGHNRDVIGHPEQHQPNLGLVLCCQYWCAVNLCCADVSEVFKSSDGMTHKEKTHQHWWQAGVWAKHRRQMK